MSHSGPDAVNLAILVVYFLRSDDDLPILELHLDRIERHTTSPFVVYGVANRVSDEARRRLESRPWVKLCEIAPTDMRGSREHGYYLDALTDLAFADGVDRIVTLDVDSFPISDDWVATLRTAAAHETGVAGILRVENGDSWLPHPSCVTMPASFFARYRPSFSPDSDRTAEFRRFLRTTGQAGDTGLDLAYTLWSHDLAWGKVLRTNVVDLHPIMAGIYGNCVFHLAGVASGTIFRRDLVASRVYRWTTPLERLPLSGRLGRTKTAALAWMREGARSSIVERNRAVYWVIRERLLADPDALFGSLRGAPSGLAARDRHVDKAIDRAVDGGEQP